MERLRGSQVTTHNYICNEQQVYYMEMKDMNENMVYTFDILERKWKPDFTLDVPEPDWVFISKVSHVSEVVQYLVEQYLYEQNKPKTEDYDGVEFQ